MSVYGGLEWNEKFLEGNKKISYGKNLNIHGYFSRNRWEMYSNLSPNQTWKHCHLYINSHGSTTGKEYNFNMLGMFKPIIYWYCPDSYYLGVDTERSPIQCFINKENDYYCKYDIEKKQIKLNKKFIDQQPIIFRNVNGSTNFECMADYNLSRDVTRDYYKNDLNQVFNSIKSTNDWALFLISENADRLSLFDTLIEFSDLSFKNNIKSGPKFVKAIHFKFCRGVSLEQGETVHSCQMFKVNKRSGKIAGTWKKEDSFLLINPQNGLSVNNGYDNLGIGNVIISEEGIKGRVNDAKQKYIKWCRNEKCCFNFVHGVSGILRAQEFAKQISNAKNTTGIYEIFNNLLNNQINNYKDDKGMTRQISSSVGYHGHSFTKFLFDELNNYLNTLGIKSNVAFSKSNLEKRINDMKIAFEVDEDNAVVTVVDEEFEESKGSPAGSFSSILSQ